MALISPTPRRDYHWRHYSFRDKSTSAGSKVRVDAETFSTAEMDSHRAPPYFASKSSRHFSTTAMTLLIDAQMPHSHAD